MYSIKTDLNQKTIILNQKRPIFNQKRPLFNQQSSRFYRKSHVFYQNRPISNQKRPILNQKGPIFNQKRPIFNQQSPRFYRKSHVAVCCSVLHLWQGSFVSCRICFGVLQCGVVCCSVLKLRQGFFVSCHKWLLVGGSSITCNNMSHIWMITATHTLQHTANTHALVGGSSIACNNTSHIWMSHVTHRNESCHTCEWVMSLVRLLASNSTTRNNTYERVATSSYACNITYERVATSHQMRATSHMKESCHMWISHVHPSSNACNITSVTWLIHMYDSFI